MQTGAWPDRTMPILPAAALDRSMIRPLTNGPRSLIRTMTDFPVREFVTFTLAPKGRLRCAAVIWAGFIISPDAVRECSAYQEAPPHWAEAGVIVEHAQRESVAATRAVPVMLDFNF